MAAKTADKTTKGTAGAAVKPKHDSQPWKGHMGTNDDMILINKQGAFLAVDERGLYLTDSGWLSSGLLDPNRAYEPRPTIVTNGNAFAEEFKKALDKLVQRPEALSYDEVMAYKNNAELDNIILPTGSRTDIQFADKEQDDSNAADLQFIATPVSDAPGDATTAMSLDI